MTVENILQENVVRPCRDRTRRIRFTTVPQGKVDLNLEGRDLQNTVFAFTLKLTFNNGINMYGSI